MENSKIQKLELLEWLASLQDSSVIKELLEWKRTHERINIEQYNKELDEANKRIDSGNFLSNEEVKKDAESW